MFRDVGCVQSEDVGAQKLHSDGKSGGNSQETMDEASGIQIKLNLPSSPFQTNVDEIVSSSSLTLSHNLIGFSDSELK